MTKLETPELDKIIDLSEADALRGMDGLIYVGIKLAFSRLRVNIAMHDLYEGRESNEEQSEH